jgi:hypothetical protein
MSIIESIDNILTSSSEKGTWVRCYRGLNPSTTTAANITSGYTNAQRLDQIITFPASGANSLGTGVTGAWLTKCEMASNSAGVGLICALEYILGTLTVATNSFADGVVMPTKKTVINGTTANIVTATQRCFLVVTTTLTAATPVITITYTNQAGTVNRTATLTLPTNTLINSAYDITPHLQSGDTGIQDITGISTNTGSAGVLKIYGLLSLSESVVGSFSAYSIHPLNTPKPLWLMEAGEVIGFYTMGSVAQNTVIACLSAVAEY